MTTQRERNDDLLMEEFDGGSDIYKMYKDREEAKRNGFNATPEAKQNKGFTSCILNCIPTTNFQKMLSRNNQNFNQEVVVEEGLEELNEEIIIESHLDDEKHDHHHEEHEHIPVDNEYHHKIENNQNLKHENHHHEHFLHDEHDGGHREPEINDKQ